MLRDAASGDGAQLPIEENRFCLFAWYFPPEVTGGTYRPSALAKYGSESGLAFTVVSAPPPGTVSPAGRYLVEQLPAAVDVLRVEAPELTPMRGALPELDGGELNVLEVWKSVVAAFRTMRPRLILATGPPFHTFVAGSLAARHFGIPLVLEYRDEWTECPFEFVNAGPADRIWEERCLAAARRVIFTTSSQMEHHLRQFSGLDRNRCVVIPNGWEPEDVVSSEPSGGAKIADHGTRHAISYTGFLGEHTPPNGFLDCLAEALEGTPSLTERFVVQFVGQKSRQARNHLDQFPIPKMIRSMEHQPKREVNRILRGSSGLLVINPPALRRYVPGKLYEYLAAGRPVLVYGDGGEVAELVRRLDAGPIVPEGDAARLVDAMEWIAEQPVGAQLSLEREEWLVRHTRKSLAMTTVEVLRDAVADQPTDAMTS